MEEEAEMLFRSLTQEQQIECIVKYVSDEAIIKAVMARDIKYLIND